MSSGVESTVSLARTEAAFWSAFLRNRNVDARSADDGAVSVAGGYALCLVGTYLEYAVGVGSTRPIRPDDLEIVRDFYAQRGLPPRLELDEAVLARDRAVLTAAGYEEDDVRLVVLQAAIGAATVPDGITVRTATNRRAWADLVVRAFEDITPDADHARLRRSTEANAASAQGLVIASIDGVDVGAAAVGITGDLALLYSGAVLSTHRKRGIHRALTAARLALATRRGATRAALKTTPDSPVIRSAAALGFTPAATRRRLRALD
ncbi:MAG TPA: GNAT family N-acetyltransferase [Candidatus Limnocylindria bacterium]|nr:GNAT family N-acetyltransferase [Candidatus Limnocylindria bacterium]